MIQRLLIVGSGSAGKRHLEVGRRLLPRADIRVLQSRRSEEVPPQANGCFHQISDALRFSPQAAVVANPAPFHLGVAGQLASAGCHLLVEKPLAHRSYGIGPLVKKIRAQNLVLQTGYNLRFLTSLVEFRRLIHGGAVGHPLTVRSEVGQWLPDWRPGTDYRKGVSARQDLGGGVLLELSHELDYLLWIFGDAKWVSAWIGRLSDLEIDVEDTGVLTMGFAASCKRREIVASVSLDFHRSDPVRKCTVVGTRGSLSWNGMTGTVEKFKRGDSRWKKIFHRCQDREESFRAQFEHFLTCLSRGNSPLAGWKAGYAVLQVVEAARKSAQQFGKRQILSGINKAHPR